MAILMVLILLPASVLAYEVKTDSTVYVGKDEVIEGNLYAGANIITVDGTVNGDVICGGQSININGTVNGDVICAGQTINLNGFIDGSARVAGNTININSEITRGVQAFGASIIMGTDAHVKRDMFIAGAFGDVRGLIDGDLHGAVATLTLDGEVGKDVKLRLDERIKKENKGFSNNNDTAPLIVTENAIIKGNLYYTSGIEGKISDGATINGEVGHSILDRKRSEKNFQMAWAWKSLFSIFAALIVGLVIISLFGEKIEKLTNTMRKKTWPSIGIGIIIMFITPILLFLLLITLIGIPLATIIFALWLIALYVGKILTSILFGRYLFEKLAKQKKQSLIWSMILGIVSTYIIFSLPFIGWLFSFVAIWLGIGGLWFYFREAK